MPFSLAVYRYSYPGVTTPEAPCSPTPPGLSQPPCSGLRAVAPCHCSLALRSSSCSCCSLPGTDPWKHMLCMENGFPSAGSYLDSVLKSSACVIAVQWVKSEHGERMPRKTSCQVFLSPLINQAEDRALPAAGLPPHRPLELWSQGALQ